MQAKTNGSWEQPANKNETNLSNNTEYEESFIRSDGCSRPCLRGVQRQRPRLGRRGGGSQPHCAHRQYPHADSLFQLGRHHATQIATLTGADLFRIEPVTPYPTEYTPTTEVARAEKEADARPAIKNTVPDWEQYDIVFIGCPVWWGTTPMIICTFAESYDFTGKTVVPFCTYASTYRDETLARIAELTPAAEHLTGCGLTSSRVNESNVTEWLQRINLIPTNHENN